MSVSVEEESNVRIGDANCNSFILAGVHQVTMERDSAFEHFRILTFRAFLLALYTKHTEISTGTVSSRRSRMDQSRLFR